MPPINKSDKASVIGEAELQLLNQAKETMTLDELKVLSENLRLHSFKHINLLSRKQKGCSD